MQKVAEAVSLGHPDKTADFISSYILDRLIEQDNSVKYAVEVMIKGNTVVLGGEIKSVVSFSDEVKALIEKIGYYGYDYPGHQTNYYYIAAQELIWRTVRPDIKVNWSTGINSTGEMIDVSKEKEEIMNLVNSHDLKPSFSEQTFKGEVGKTITLKDENHVLDDYDISESKYHKILKDGDTLTITLNENEVLEEEIYLTRKHYDDAPLLVYNKGDSQKLAALRITTDKDTFVKIKNEELPQIIEVPNTGYFDFSSIFGTLLVGVGLALFKVH